MNAIITSTDIEGQVRRTLDGSVPEIPVDVPALVEAIIDRYGRVDIETIDHEEFWPLVAEHEIVPVRETMIPTPTPDLRPGQLVSTHGMRVRLGERVETPEGAIAFRDCPIENVAELAEDHCAVLRWMADAQDEEVTTWTIQGNELAQWMRIVES